jgi:hypothetical protein
MDPNDLALAEIAFGENNPTKDEIIQELINEGVILPTQDWGDDFQAKKEAITTDWFARHPECKRGTGQFPKMYPEVVKAQDIIIKMSELGRITPEEFLILYKEIKNF